MKLVVILIWIGISFKFFILLFITKFDNSSIFLIFKFLIDIYLNDINLLMENVLS